jgi:hypothetical protein
MLSRLKRRPSPTTAIALVALFVALGGTSYAALVVTGRNVRNGSLTGADVRTNSLTGVDVRGIHGADVALNSLTSADVAESKLGKVPTAKSADRAVTATTATSTGSVNGLAVRKFSVKIPTGAPEQVVTTAAGVTVRASCPAGAPALRATSDINDAVISVSTINASNASFGGVDKNFDIGQSADLDRTADNGTGVAAYSSPTGATATVTYGFGSAPTFGATNAGCAVWGTAVGA